MHRVIDRMVGKYRRTLANQFHRRMITVECDVPIISFTFDDAPKTAFEVGAGMLGSYGLRGTFFVSLGLLGCETEVGTIGTRDDLARAAKDGNELGCHTFDHVDAWQTSAGAFTQSVAQNRHALEALFPGTTFRTFAYPKSGATASVKPYLEQQFICCRGGGQTANVGPTDLNLLKACFIDKRTKTDISFVKQLINYTSSARGWLILATHDVTDNPSAYGCTPGYLEEVVKAAVRSGALVLPVGEACEQLVGSSERSV